MDGSPSEAQIGLGNIPVGTVTFLFTDIEGSTKLLERLKKGYITVLAEQRDILRSSFAQWNGREVDTQGDSFFIAFARADDAVHCVIEAQKALSAHTWPGGLSVRVRMGLHTGEPMVGKTGYVGLDVHRAARIAAAGYGGQVLLSQATRELIYQDLPKGTILRDLGAHKLKDIRHPQQIYQLEIEGLPSEFPALKTLATEEEPPTPGEPPFKGLQYFTEEDAEIFFGRSEVTHRLVEAISTEHFLAVIGASGSGKSSVVRAGLIPAIKKSQPRRWQVVLLTPTAHPIEALAIALTRDIPAITSTATLIDDLHREPRALHLFARKNLKNANILLAVDQFEELFTLCRNEPERQAFIDSLLCAAQAADGVVHLLIALRADFYEHLAQYAELRKAVAGHQEYLGSMTPGELRQAIEEPARLGGWEFSPGLVELMLQEVGAEAGGQLEPGALPLLSHALLETWKHRRSNLMNLKAYGESGGVRKAIAHTAESLYTNELSSSQQQIARNIFLRLTELGEGTQDTRRRASLQELYPSAPYGDPKDVEEVLLKLADARLIITGEGTAEVAHEALIREWPTLREWLMQDREGLRLQRHLSEAAHEWMMLERDPGMLYRGARLVQGMEWAKTNPNQLNQQEQAFLDASKALAEQEQAEKEAVRQRELEAAQNLADEQSRSAKRLRKRAIYLSLALAAAVIMIGVTALFAKFSADNADLAEKNLITAQLASTQAVAQQAIAQSEANTRATAEVKAIGEANTRATAEAVANEQAQLAFSRELAAAAVSNLSVDPQRSLLLAIEAVNTYNTSQAENALHQAVSVSRLRDTLSFPQVMLYGISFSPDGTHLAAIGMNSKIEGKVYPGSIYLWDTKDAGQRIENNSLQMVSNPIDFEAYNAVGNGVVFSPDGSQLAGVSSGNSAKIWDSHTGKVLHTLIGHEDWVTNIRFSPDGKLVLTGSLDKSIKIWDAVSGKELQAPIDFRNWGDVYGFSPDGKYLGIGSFQDSTAIIGKVSYLSDGKLQFTKAYTLVNGPSDWYMSGVVFSPDGTKLATGSSTNLRVYDISSASSSSYPILLFNIAAHKETLNAINFDNTGDRVITSSWDGLTKVWDATSGELLFTLAGNAGGVAFAAINPHGTRLVTAHTLENIEVWDITENGNQEWFILHGEPLSGYFNEDGSKLFIRKERNEKEIIMQIWGISASGLSQEPIHEIKISVEGNPIVWIDTNFSLLFIMRRNNDSLTLNLDVLDVKTSLLTKSYELFRYSGPDDFVYYNHLDSYQPNLNRMQNLLTITDQRGSLILWDVSTGSIIQEIKEIPESLAGAGIVISPGCEYFALFTPSESEAYLWNVQSGKLERKFTGHSTGLSSANFSRDGAYLLTGSYDNTAKLWDVKTGQEILTLRGNSSYIKAVDFSPNGKYLATGGGEGIVRVWDALTGQELFQFPGNTILFSPDSMHLLTKHYDGYDRGYYLNVNDLMTVARSRLVRTWTDYECQTFLHMDTCPESPQ